MDYEEPLTTEGVFLFVFFHANNVFVNASMHKYKVHQGMETDLPKR